MATEAKNVGIKNSMSLIAFARQHGRKMQIGNFVNKESGEEFSSCIFTNPVGGRTFVAFSSKLGVLTPAQVVAQKDKLQVVELESGNYILCKQGDNSWQDVDLGL